MHVISTRPARDSEEVERRIMEAADVGYECPCLLLLLQKIIHIPPSYCSRYGPNQQAAMAAFRGAASAAATATARRTAASTLASRQAHIAPMRSFASQAAGPSSAASAPRAARATWTFAAASAVVVAGLLSSKAVAAEPSSSSSSPPLQKRQRYGDRLRANKGGPIIITRAEDEDAETEAAADEHHDIVLDVSSGRAIQDSTGGDADSAIDTIADVIAADAPLEDDDQQSAYDPSTGEINWDCPCLGGMAHGPCGDQFKDAFSCFVYSEKEPKGIDCVDKFKAMQDCFRQHPEVYKEELEQEERDEMDSLVYEAETALGVQKEANLEASVAQAQ
ncbi:unnamed protein product [Jaminaea pallidilutea]